jgi:hypothetical protein
MVIDNLSTGSIDNIMHLKGRAGFEYSSSPSTTTLPRRAHRQAMWYFISLPRWV